MMFYYSTPQYSVALNAKVGSSSMARAIICEFYPEQDSLIRHAAYPAGKSEHTRLWHWMCNGRPKPDKPVVLLVRDPVDRFVSACQQLNIQQKDIDKAIDSLLNDALFMRSPPEGMTQAEWDTMRARAIEMHARRNNNMLRNGEMPLRLNHLRDDVHFFHQHKYAVGPTTCFQFPRDIKAAADFIGLTRPMPESNKARREKVNLTAEQKVAVQEYYAADQELFDSISAPGYVYIREDAPTLVKQLEPV